jgi:hypothetical protein
MLALKSKIMTYFRFKALGVWQRMSVTGNPPYRNTRLTKLLCLPNELYISIHFRMDDIPNSGLLLTKLCWASNFGAASLTSHERPPIDYLENIYYNNLEMITFGIGANHQ